MNTLSCDPTLLINGSHYDPHAILGIHSLNDERKVIRVLRPGANEVYIELKGAIVPLHLTHCDGLFELEVPPTTAPQDYKVYHSDGSLQYDPYAFLPILGDVDLYLFGKGTHYDIYKVLGGRITDHQGVRGVKFAVWAPSAARVSLIADFNHWDGRVNPMRSLGSSGVWELFVPGLSQGCKYKFEI